jgi:hypothetical protein
MAEIDSIVEFSVNLKDQEAPEPLPAGKYTGVIRAAEVKLSQRETKYGAISFHIGADQFPADYTEGTDEGITIIYRRVGLEDNPQARFGTRRFMEAIGAPLSKKIDVTEWVGMEAQVEVTHETFENVKRANINRVNPL